VTGSGRNEGLCNTWTATDVECREGLMRIHLLGLATLLVLGTTSSAYGQARQTAPPPAAAAAKTVTVSVTYTGKGAVDAKHNVLVFLFADPNVGPGSIPISGPQVMEKNGSTVTFKDVSTTPVYIVAVYDEQGGYTGQNPPPAGTPIGMYSKDAKSPPAPVTPGPKTVLKMSFSDAKRFGK
jgi:hypothetical protein